MTGLKEVWVFSGVNAKFPAAVFDVKEDALGWIKKNRLTGVLTKYPVGISVYERAIEIGNFKVRSEMDLTSEFIGKFSSAA